MNCAEAWISIAISENVEGWARRRAAHVAHLLGPGGGRRFDGPHPWAGYVTEWALDKLLDWLGIAHVWTWPDLFAPYDFALQFCGRRTTVDVKGGVRLVLAEDYTSAVHEGQCLNDAVDHFFFGGFQPDTRLAFLVGGVARRTFLDYATRHKEGERVHPGFTVLPGGECRNGPWENLDAPLLWLLGLVPGVRPDLIAAERARVEALHHGCGGADVLDLTGAV